jgi:hypothetical protein
VTDRDEPTINDLLRAASGPAERSRLLAERLGLRPVDEADTGQPDAEPDGVTPPPDEAA